MNAQKYFEQHAEELIASYAGKNVVLFFRGFVPANVRWLAHREDAVLPAGKILNEDGSISIAKIDVAKRKLVQSLMMQEEGVTVGIYEEMLAILQNVQDPKEMFDAEFIVEKNAGWRIDYFITSPQLKDKLEGAEIHSEIMGSDHCPVELQITL